MSEPNTHPKESTITRIITWLLVVGGVVGFLSAFTLAVEKVAILKDPTYQPSCNLSPLLSCGSVMITKQAEAFGFPNPFIGIAGFAIVVTVGMGILAGAKYKRWFWLGLEAGTIFGVAFVHWLFFQSVYVIGALCPYCMVVWTVTIPIFWYTTLYNLQTGAIPTPAKLRRLVSFAQTHHADILLVWYLLIIAAILSHFWWYWSTLI
jgi:uncharacterized membrane protein